MEKMFKPDIFIQERDIIETEEGHKELRDIQIKIED